MDIKNYMDQVRREQLNKIQQNKPILQDIPSSNTNNVINSSPSPSMPSLVEMGKNMLETAKNIAAGVIKGDGINLTEEEAKKRLSICESCEFYINSRCSKCGCYMAVKTYLKAANCPVSKW